MGGDDRCPAWTPDLKIFVFDSLRQRSFGAKDIWWVYFKDVVDYPLAMLRSPYLEDMTYERETRFLSCY
jgi:hypothetical protein